MNDQLNILQTYRMKVHFFDMIFFSTYDDDLAGCCGGSFIYSANAGECPETMDPAYWEDWMDAVKVVIQDNSITYDSVTLTVEQSYAVMHQYLVRYCEVGSGPTMKILRDLTNQNVQQSQIMQWFLELWNKSLHIVLQEDPHKKSGLGFGENTIIDKRESFATMQAFLDELCQHNYDQDLIQLVQNSRLKNKNDYWAPVLNVIEFKTWEIWQKAIDDILLQNQNSQLNLLVAYKAMPLFLMNYFKNNRSIFIDSIISNFKTENCIKSRDLFYWWFWISATNKVNAEQTTMRSNLISIKTNISQDAALKIIKIWLQDYKDLLGTDFVNNFILLDTSNSFWQQDINEIKQNKRSYLLLDDEVTVLEIYHIMMKLLKSHNKNVIEFQVDQEGKPVNFVILLNWIRVCEQTVNHKI